MVIMTVQRQNEKTPGEQLPGPLNCWHARGGLPPALDWNAIGAGHTERTGEDRRKRKESIRLNAPKISLEPDNGDGWTSPHKLGHP